MVRLDRIWQVIRPIAEVRLLIQHSFGRHRRYPMLSAHTPALILAPMDGVTDAPMRALQGETGAFTFAVSEFLRISHSIPHRGVFHRHMPELLESSKTPTGMPVQLQLLGGNPE